MGLRIDLPQAGILSTPLLNVLRVTESSNDPLETGGAYVLDPTTPITLRLPDSNGPQGPGAVVIVKNISTPNVLVTIESNLFEGQMNEIRLDNNRPVTFVWTDIQGFGWLMI